MADSGTLFLNIASTGAQGDIVSRDTDTVQATLKSKARYMTGDDTFTLAALPNILQLEPSSPSAILDVNLPAPSVITATHNAESYVEAVTAFSLTVNTSGDGSEVILYCPSGVTFDGTNDTASFSAPNDSMTFIPVSATRYLILSKTAGVTLS